MHCATTSGSSQSPHSGLRREVRRGDPCATGAVPPEPQSAAILRRTNLLDPGLRQISVEFPGRRSILCQASRSAGSGWVTRAAPARMIRALMPTLNGSTSHRPRATPSGVTPIPKTCFLRVRNQGRRCVPVRCTTARGPCGHSSADQRMLDAAYRHKMCGDATPLVKLQSGVARRRFLGLVGAALFVGPSPQPGTALPF
jgi:hypothetical protein